MTNRFPPAFLPLLAILGSVTFLALGTSLAKQTLFPLIGAQGTTAVRVGFSALLMLLLWRPWRRALGKGDAWPLVCYGAALGMMNLCFYLSLRTVPFGIAVAIEFAGPLGVALLGSRRAIDLVWVGLAVAGLLLLLPLGHGAGAADPAGVLYALAAAVFWATYIVFGKRIGHLDARQSVPLGLAVASLVAVPAGLPYAGPALLSPTVLALGLVVALVSSAIPIFLEMLALKRLPSQSFGIMVSMEPAVAALIALAMLDETLSVLQWLAISLIVAASMGSAFRTAPTEVIARPSVSPGTPAGRPRV